MDIFIGLSALKTSTELLRSLRDRLKSGDAKGEEVIGRIGEIYDYIVESKDALVDAKDEIYALREKLRARTLYEHRFNVLWRKDGDGRYIGPFCPICKGEGKEMPLRPEPAFDQKKGNFHMACHVFHQQAMTPQGRPITYEVPKDEVPGKW